MAAKWSGIMTSIRDKTGLLYVYFKWMANDFINMYWKLF